MIAEKWRGKLPQPAPGTDGKQSDMDEAYLLLGTSDTRGNAAVSPALQVWLGDQLSKEATAAKERRKAREERALAAGPKK